MKRGKPDNSNKAKMDELSETLQIRGTCLFRIQGDGSLHVLDLESRRIYRIQNIAAHVFLQLDGSRSIDQIVSSSKRKFGIEHPDYKALVMDFIEKLRELKLAVVAEQRGQPAQSSKWIEKLDRVELRLLAPALLTTILPPAARADGSSGSSGGCDGGCAGSDGGGSGCGGGSCAGGDGGGSAAGDGAGSSDGGYGGCAVPGDGGGP